MGEANKDGFVRNITLNFLQRFKPQNPEFSDLEQPDINLGLSLGGCYTQIPEENPLIRTSSLNGDSIQNENEGGAGGDLPIERSASVPTQAEQVLRKLKEMQAMKRMEAKRRLMEKHRQRGGGSEEEKARMAAKSNWAVESAVKNPGTTGFSRPVKKLKSNVSPPPNLIIQGPQNSTAAKAHTVSPPTRAIENGKSVDPANYRSKPMVNLGTMANGKLAYPANYRPAPAIAMEKTANEKTINLTNSRHPDSAVSFRKRANGKPVEPAKTEQERPSKKVKVFPNGIHDIMTMEMMKLMPSVTTTGDGPNGRKIEGLLYKYTKGHVSIVCVCHGTFLSPAEFVKHAGGGDVENPMKRINVLPAAL